MHPPPQPCRILEKVAPRQLVVAHGPPQAREALAAFCRSSRVLRALRTRCCVPSPLAPAQLALTSSWQVELGEELAGRTQLQQQGEYQLAWLAGDLAAGQQVGWPGDVCVWVYGVWGC